MIVARISGPQALHSAFDEARFGPAKTLNLRNTLPTAREAVGRAESWIRERQASRAGELLIITGRGNQSDGGIAVVREAVVRLFASLRRRGVISAVKEHTPGSFVVTPAPLSALREAGRRRREPEAPTTGGGSREPARARSVHPRAVAPRGAARARTSSARRTPRASWNARWWSNSPSSRRAFLKDPSARTAFAPHSRRCCSSTMTSEPIAILLHDTLPAPRRMIRDSVRVAAFALLLPAFAISAQEPSLPGYGAAASASERTLEANTAARMSADTARAESRALSHQIHIAGTPAQAWTRDYVIAAMKSWGMETEVREYVVWMPHTTTIQVWRISPDTVALNLAEGPVPQDTTSWNETEAVIANGYSGTGDVSGQVVYVNYGLIEDYAQLDSMGVSVKGKIAIARYGRSVSRHQGARGREARRARPHHLQRSGRRWLRARRCVSRGTDAAVAGRAARQRDER